LHFSRLLAEAFSHLGEVYRFGGEEFVIIVTGCRESDLEAGLDNFRILLANHIFPVGVKVKFSGGYTYIYENDNFSDPLMRADRALYFAKENGRDQYFSYESLVVENRIEPICDTGSITIWKNSAKDRRGK
jgi:diguanylate cyclase (GGDEF)-like protein